MTFLVIFVGINILQLSKVDPTEFELDRRSTIMAFSSRLVRNKQWLSKKQLLSGLEEPGIDTLRRSFGTVGSIIRARTGRIENDGEGRTSGKET